MPADPVSDAGREKGCLPGGDPEGLSAAGQETAPRSQSRQQAGRGEVQGGFRRLRPAGRCARSARVSTAARSMRPAPSGRATILPRLRRRAVHPTRTQAMPDLPTSPAATISLRKSSAGQARGNMRMRGQDAHYRLALDFLDADQRRQAAAHPARRLRARRRHPARHARRPGPASARQGQAGHRRRSAGRRTDRDRGSPAPHLHTQGRRHSSRAADLAERSRARRQGEGTDAARAR